MLGRTIADLGLLQASSLLLLQIAFSLDVVLKLHCEEDHMKMMVRKEVFEALKIPLTHVHLKNSACKVAEMEEDRAIFFAATLTSENHTLCGSVIQVRAWLGGSAVYL